VSGILKHWEISDIKALRFALGLTLATAIAFGIAWPISFLSVLLVGKLLSTDKPYLSLSEGMGLLVIISISMFGGLLLALVLLQYPSAFMMTLTLILLRIYYLGTRGAAPVLIIMMLIGFTVIPMLGLQSMTLAYEAVLALIFSTAVALTIAYIAYALVPGGTITASQNREKKPHGDVASAVKSTVVVLPLLLYIYLGNRSDAILMLVFVSILSQNTEFETGVKTGLGLVTGNLIGGAFGIVIYNVLVAVPSFVFFILLMSSVWLFFSQQVFLKNTKGVLFGIAMSTIIVVLSGAFGYSSSDASNTVYIRILQLIMVAVYIAMSFSIINSLMLFFRRDKEKHVQAIP
jgi:hypothetical protein